MLFPPLDPNEQFRSRREAARRRKRRRRAALTATVLAGVALVGGGAQLMGGERAALPGASGERATALPTVSPDGPRPLPLEIRGVHVTMGLASLPGRLEQYAELQQDGLTALELDVKDEDGHVGFVDPSLRLARSIGAARAFYDAPRVARALHRRGLYLIGRVVVFEDPVLSHARPDLAIRRRGGGVWRDAAGLGWTNPYDRRVWDYNVDIAAAAARAGFDEILFDYVRFPSDGAVDQAVYENRRGLAKVDAVPSFLRYAERRLRPLGARVSASVFGLSAARDLGIGQLPRRFAPHVDAIYAMTYPALFGPGELGIAEPTAAPGATVAEALRRFRRALRGRDTLLVTWVQDWSYARTYGLDEVRAQIEAARLAGAKGFLLWNADGVYTEGALEAPSAS